MKFLKIYFFLIILIALKFDYAQGEDFKSYFPLQSGNSWEFTEVINNETVIKKITCEGEGQLENSNETKKWIYDQNEVSIIDGFTIKVVEAEEGLKLSEMVVNNRFCEVSPYLLWFPFRENFLPTQTSYILTDEGKNSRTITRELKYLGKEEVTVAAGHFDNCIKFWVSDMYREKENFFQQIYSFQWFAKDVGLVQKIQKIMLWSETYGDVFIKNTKLELRKAIIDGMVWENDTQTY